MSDVLPSIWGGLLIFQVWLSHIPVIERKMNHQLKQKCRISKGNIFYLSLCCQIKPSQTLEHSFPPLFLRPTKPLKSLSLLTARHHAMTTMQRSKLQMSAWQQLFEWLRFRTSDASLKASVSFGRLCCLAEKVHPACGSKLAGAFMMYSLRFVLCLCLLPICMCVSLTPTCVLTSCLYFLCVPDSLSPSLSLYLHVLLSIVVSLFHLLPPCLSLILCQPLVY